MAKYTAESTYIASIFPGTLWPIHLNFGPSPQVNSRRRTIYKLEPVKRGQKPYVIEVADSFENIFNPMKSPARGEQPWSSQIVPYQEVCDCLLKQWNGNMIGVPAGAALGIIQIASSIPTQEEIDSMMKMQTVFAEWSFQEGEKCHRENNWKEIRGIWREMAVWLGKKCLWATPEMAAELVNCPHCFELINPQATVCRVCGREVATGVGPGEFKRGPGRPRKEEYARVGGEL